MKTAPVPELEAWVDEGTTQIEGHQSVLLLVNQASLPIIIKPTGCALILGRATDESSLQVAIDLTPYGGYEQGVSRVHAMLKCENGTLTIEDMGSTNGTCVNGHPLVPGQHFLLRDGDEVRLGQLITHVYFR
jgi:pSer/pThr/pTyr-binding forkhead associated (FHA) protein